MSLEFIYVTRHGFRPAFAVDPASGTYTTSILSPTGIPTDPPLTSYGVEQANELADHLLKVADPPIDRVYSSPYYRCLQTINPFVSKLNKNATATADGSNLSGKKPHLETICVEGGIGEWFGSAPWDHPAPAPLSRLQELFPNIDRNYVSQITPPRKGETLSELHDRVAAAMDAIITQCDRDGKKAVIVCTHAAAVIALGRVLTGAMPEDVADEDFAAYTCGLSIYRRRRGTADAPTSESHANTRQRTTPNWKNGAGVRGGWKCEADSDCSFLTGGPERGWRFSGEESFDAIGNKSLAGSGAGLGVDVEVQKSGENKESGRPMTDGSKL